MKKIRIIVCAFIALLMLSSCGGPELISIIPAYKGEPVTSTDHEFTKEDFYVLGTYTDGNDKQITYFEFTVEKMSDGYYWIFITYEDQDNYCFVPINMDFYPSDAEEGDEHDHTHEE